MLSAQFILIALLLVNSSFAYGVTEKQSKRGIIDTSFGYGGFNSFETGDLSQGLFQSPSVDYQKSIFLQKSYSVSPAEIASAIQAAKEASSSVMDAQHRVQDAKEAVLHQQHIATQKQSQATLALQKAEAAAAVAQQESKSAANGLIQAQQRLAHAKAEVAELQKIASAKESHAAAIIQKSAHAAAAEVQKTDEVARKISSLQHNGNTILRQVAAAKQGSLTATSAAVAASADHSSATGNSYGGAHGQWYGGQGGNYVQYNPWGK